MRKIAIGLLLGSISVLLLTDLPHFGLSGSILFVSLFFSVYFKHKYKSIFSTVLMGIMGFCLTAIVADLQQRQSFESFHEGKDLIVTGKVVSLVKAHDNSLSFLFKVADAILLKDEIPIDWTGLIKLSAYRDLPDVKAGERWQFQVRLKRSSGFMNPGGFDFEKWSFSQGIDARGYLRKSILHKRLAETSWYSVNRWRASIRDKITHLLDDQKHAAILRALMIADKNAMTVEHWEVLRSTGTSHLMAISGLHIGLVAGFGLVLIYAVWWCFPSLSLYLPVRHAGAIVGVLLATFYAMLAGFSIPTQRALLVVTVALILLANRRYFSASRVLALAMIAVLLIDPLAVMSVGFFLSFSAVGLILWILSRAMDTKRFRLLRLQAYLSLLMIPIGFLFFGEGSLISPAANLIAIPWVSLVVVPFSFLAVFLSYISESLSVLVFNFVAVHLEGLFILLGWLADLPKVTVGMQSLPLAFSLLLVLTALLLLLPSGIGWRYSAFFVMLPLAVYQAPKPKDDGEFWLTVLDVGQGLAVVVQTHDKTLVYDTGDRVHENYDLGKMVVLPYLKQQSISSIDALVISHDDRDHSGGAKALFDEMPIKQLFGSRDDMFTEHLATVCTGGTSWVWGKVLFEFLHPSETVEGNDNNRSCVLRVSNQYHAVLLTGDIQKKAERALLKVQREHLAADILLMPHHGSNSSSTNKFITAVSPEWAIASAGYRSRFRHPDRRVLRRYQKHSVKILSTAYDGAIQFQLLSTNKQRKPLRYRLENEGFWSRKTIYN